MGQSIDIALKTPFVPQRIFQKHGYTETDYFFFYSYSFKTIQVGKIKNAKYYLIDLWIL